MQDSLYWLISITTDSARVSLASNQVVSQGQEISWNNEDPDSLLKAIDTSLSSQNNDATSNCSFIVPSVWVTADGRIFPELLKSLKYICDKLKLHPLGFISHDDAFIESYNTSDSFPASYILVYFSVNHYQISLVYLGEIKKRIVKDFNNDFSVTKFEEILSQIDFPSALPPKIIVTGSFTSEIVDDLKNYNWLAHKDIESFLHLPEVISLDLLELDQIFINTISQQISKTTPTTTPETIIDATPINETPLDEIDAETLGFTSEDSPIPPPEIKKIIPKFSLPHISFPKINLNYYWLLPLTLLPFLPVLPLFFANVDLTIYQNPVEFSENFDINLDPNSNVSTQTFDLNVGTSAATTGKREVGNKAKGEVTIFNKLDHSLSLNKGLIIIDTTGKKFLTTNNILVPGSTYNLDSGVINMGQIKANVEAENFGPEYNLSTSTLSAKDNPNILVKSVSAFSGGSRETVTVVTTADRNNLLESAKLLLKDQANTQINSQKTPENTILDSTMVFDNQRTVYNREVGEDADVLTLNLSSKVSFLFVNLAQKQKLVSTLFPQKKSLESLDINSAVVNLSFVPKNKLTLSGKANPKIDVDQLKSSLVGKSNSEVKTILNSLPRFYQYQISNSLAFLNLLGRLPVNKSHINIIIKN